jgi:hypothetical protein
MRARAHVHISRARARARTRAQQTHTHITTRARARCGAAEVDHQDQALGFQGHRSSPSPLPLSALPLSALSHLSHSANCRAVIGRHRRRRRRRRCGVRSRRRCGRESPVPVPMWQGRAQPRCRCGRAWPSPKMQMWAGRAQSPPCKHPAAAQAPTRRATRAEALRRWLTTAVRRHSTPLQASRPSHTHYHIISLF